MKTIIGIVLVTASLLVGGEALSPQAPASQNTDTQNQKKPANTQPVVQQNANPFPEDESSVPVLPSKNAPNLPPGTFDGSVNGRAVLPAGDVDPVQSPDDSPAAANGSGPDSSSSSTLNGIDSLMPEPDNEPTKHGRKQDQIVPEHHENAAEDENVGKYYLDNKDWRAALSRYQSAMVLDPENPDVYWGLAEANRHLGNFAEARTNYQKVIEYDPDSKHAKEAKRALSEPELANLKPSQAKATQ